MTATMSGPAKQEPRPANARSVFDEAFLHGKANTTEVLLVRHGQQEFDPQGPVGRVTDAPLSELGRTQARLIADRLSQLEIGAVYASPLQRAHDTGRAIAGRHGLTPIVLDDLREVGIFRDVPAEQSAVSFIGAGALTAARERMLAERCWDAYPLSEPCADFRARVVDVIDAIVDDCASARIVIVCHGGVINGYIASLIGSPYDMFFQPAHTSISIVASHDGRRALRSLNDVLHLQTSEGNFATV